MKIEFHYTYLLVAISFILTGYFSNLIVFTSIILIHELGHYIIAKKNNLAVEKITLYPYGGTTKLNIPINTKINKELKVAIAGILFQTIYYIIIVILYKNNLIRAYIYNQFTTYHYNILLFNLLPIHPLDGSKILTLLLSKILPYKKTIYLNIIISVITLTALLATNYYQFNYTTILIITIVATSIHKYYKEINYLFNKFLLERYLHNITFSNTKRIYKLDNMYKEKYHIIKQNKQYITEKQALNQRFKGKYWNLFD